MEIKRRKWDESLGWGKRISDKEIADQKRMSARLICPRCSGKTRLEEYLYCPYCGWYDYDVEEARSEIKRDDTMKGNVHFVKYGGDITNFKSLTLKVVVGKNNLGKHTGAIPLIEPECPFCGVVMKSKNVSYRKVTLTHVRDGMKFTLFVCISDHRIELHLGEEKFIWI